MMLMLMRMQCTGLGRRRREACCLPVCLPCFIHTTSFYKFYSVCGWKREGGDTSRAFLTLVARLISKLMSRNGSKVLLS